MPNAPLLSANPADRALTIARVTLGPVAALTTYLVLPTAEFDASGQLIAGLSPAGHATAAVAVLMAIWWLLEAIPLSVTALLPVTLLPLLGATTISDAAAPYARDMLFLFLGGFMLGLAMERWNLHKRIALLTLLLIGTSPTRIIAGFMLATAFLSAWVSNTATAILMLPIAISVISLVGMQRHTSPHGHGHPDEPESAQHAKFGTNFSTALLLGIAFSASIGGVATLIGTPPNLVLAAVAHETMQTDISMARWMLVAVPMAAVFLPITWLVLTRLAFPLKVKTIPGAKELVNRELRELGPMSRGEIIVLIIFVATALSWITRPQLVQLGEAIGFVPLINLRDSSVALLACFAMFMIPVKPSERVFVMDWDTVSAKMPWGIFLLFGGGLSLAAAISSTGLDAYIGGSLESLAGMPPWLLIVILAAVVNTLTGVTSNTALTTAVLPILVASAPVLDIEPMKLLLPATMAASFAFMLPVATPPNAVVFGSGRVKIGDMARAGLILNFVGIALASIAGIFFSGFIAH